MKKQLLCLIAALVLLLGLCVSALAYDSAHVFDDAQLLSEDEIGALEARCQEAEDTFGCGVYIVTTDDYSLYDGAESIEAFTENSFLTMTSARAKRKMVFCWRAAWPSVITTCVPMAKPATVPLRTTARACSLNAIS